MGRMRFGRRHRFSLVVFAAIFSALTIMTQGCGSTSGIREVPAASSRSTNGTLFVKVQSGVYVIKEGDKLEISVWDYPEFTTATTVSMGGTISIPLVGDIKAAGMTKEDFTAAAKKRLVEYVKGEPKLTVNISSPMALKVSVIGAVTRQDNFPVTSEVSLLEIVSTAGGGTAESDLSHVRIIRAGANRDPIDIDLARAIETGEIESIPKIRPGDTVYIPKKENFVRSFSDFMRDAVLLLGFFRVLY